MAYIELDKKQWHEVHNALCYLEMGMAPVGLLKEGDKVLSCVEKLRASLGPAYDQDNAAVMAWMTLAADTRKALSLSARWSMDIGNSFQEDHNLGPATILRYYSYVATIKGTWWQDLFIAANEVIEAYAASAGGTDHIFIEGFRKNTDGSLTLQTGS